MSLSLARSLTLTPKRLAIEVRVSPDFTTCTCGLPPTSTTGPVTLVVTTVFGGIERRTGWGAGWGVARVGAAGGGSSFRVTGARGWAWTGAGAAGAVATALVSLDSGAGAAA